MVVAVAAVYADVMSCFEVTADERRKKCFFASNSYLLKWLRYDQGLR